MVWYGIHCQEYLTIVFVVLTLINYHCYVISRKGSCTTDLLAPYLDAG